jgi:O-antigen/teichoic acid export membrane protein
MKYAQVSVYLTAIPAFLFMFFGREILILVTTPEIAEQAYAIMTLLAFGTLLNGVVSPPYILSVAAGQARIPLLVNLCGLVFYFPSLYLLIVYGGIEGAGLAWILINIYYLLVLIPLIQRLVLGESSFEYLSKSFLPFIALSIIFWIGKQLVAPFEIGSWKVWLGVSASTLVFAGLGFFFLEKSLRNSLRDLLSVVWRRRSTAR